jgi:hypothetical protein
MRTTTLLVSALAALALACGGDDGPPDDGVCVGVAPPWIRAEPSAGGAVTINEVMYHPRGDQPAWIELHNPFAFDADLSGFRLGGAIDFTFPDGTRIAPDGYLVIASAAMPGALGPFGGALPRGPGAVELWNNAGRLLDAVAYGVDEPWPVAADGSGASLAKRAPDDASGPAERWIASARVGGTPGAANVALASPPATRTLVPAGSTWRYLASPAPSGWQRPDFDDRAWAEAPAAFWASDRPPPSIAATARFTADNFFALYLGRADGTGLRLLGRDAIGDWTSTEAFTFTALADEHLYVAAWEAPGDDGGPQMLIGQLELPDGTRLPTDPASFEVTRGPTGAAPGGALTDPAPTVAQLQATIAGATWTAPQAVAPVDAGPWGPALVGQLAPTARYLWPDTFAAASATNAATTYALFRTRQPVAPGRGATEVTGRPITSYYRTRFEVGDGVRVLDAWLTHLVDDGAVFYLDGVEVLRVGMPAGPVTATTLAATTVGEATPSAPAVLAAAALGPGPHVLAVEVHQAIASDPDLRFDAALAARAEVVGPDDLDGLALSEIAAAGDSVWLELVNRGAAPLALGGEVVATAGGEHVLAAATLAPGALLHLDAETLGLRADVGQPVFLYAADRTTVLDAVRLAAGPQARHPDGDWRRPAATTPGAANTFAPTPAVVVSELSYHAPDQPLADGSFTADDLEWIELHNRGAAALDVGGWQLVDAIGYQVPAGTKIAADGYLIIASDPAAFTARYGDVGAPVVGGFAGSLANRGDRLVVRDACGNPVEEVAYHDGGRWPEAADGGGATLVRLDERAASDAAESWAASDERAASGWQTIEYQAVATPSAVGPDGVWHELVLGLLDAGVVLIDDVRVVVDPATAATELCAGGDFESGGAGFRWIGNHRHSAVIEDPEEPGNHVLRLVATGPTEHMHNHVEVTLAGGHRITDGRTYRISLRARWQAGSGLLNTRLYFNRLARTTSLPVAVAPGNPGRPDPRAGNLGPTYRDLAHAPVVPAAGEPVTVAVDADDPDGVAAVTLFLAVDGGPPTSVVMTATDGGLWTAQVPGHPAGAVVQFWIDAVDGVGARAQVPAGGPAARALWQVDDGRGTGDALRDVRIVMTPADAAWLFAAPDLMSNDWVGATVIYDGRDATYDVGVRLKGSQRGRPTQARTGFGLRFPPERLFRGVHRTVLIDRSQGVSFGQRELFFFQAMNRAGAVPSQYDDLIEVVPPRRDLTGPAHLQLARFGGLFLDHQFERGGDGGLFEYELVYYPTTTVDGTPTGAKLPQPDQVVGTAIRDLGPDEEAYRMCFINKANRGRDDYRGWLRFAQAFGTTGAAFDAQVDAILDVDQWLRALAFATLSGAIDNYASGAAHNAEFYLRPSDGKALFFPHDLDFLGSARGPVIGSADLAKLIAAPARRRSYYGHLHDIITTSYNATYLAPWAAQLGALLPGQDFAGHLAYVAERAAWVRDGAPDAITRAIPPVGFAIATNGGAPLAVAAATVDLEGPGWVDVHTITANGGALTVTWPAVSTWRASVGLACGANALALTALDRRGAAVGTDTITVTRTGPGCP